MAQGYIRFQNGLQLIGQHSALPSIAGEMAYDDSTNQFIVFDTQQRVILLDGASQTITNKNFQDTTNYIVNVSDPTKRVNWDLSGATTGTLLTLADIATVNRTITFPDGTDTLAGISLAQTLTNKVLTGNTAANLISGSGEFIFNTSGTITVPNGTDTLAALALSQTLSNKIISSPTANPSSTGIIRLANADSVSWRNSGNSADIALKPDADGFLQYNNIDLVNLSGTQTLTNKTIDTTLNTIKATGITSGYVLTADGANGTSFVAPSASTSFDSATTYTNGSISSSVATNALTIALKNKTGSDPSALSPVTFSVRDSNGTTGTYTNISVTSALSVTVPAGVTLGTANSTQAYIYVYLYNSSGTPALGVSLNLFDEGTIHQVHDISSGTSPYLLYGSVGLSSNVGLKVVGRLLVFEATAGTWITSAQEISNITFSLSKLLAVGTVQTSDGTLASTTSYAAPTNAPAITITTNRTGYYKVSGSFPVLNGTAGQTVYCKIATTAGSPTTLFVQECVIAAPSGATQAKGSVSPYLLVFLTANTSYTFTVQLKNDASGNLTLQSSVLANGTALMIQEL